jgi:hypothetical protein
MITHSCDNAVDFDRARKFGLTAISGRMHSSSRDGERRYLELRAVASERDAGGSDQCRIMSLPAPQHRRCWMARSKAEAAVSAVEALRPVRGISKKDRAENSA